MAYAAGAFRAITAAALLLLRAAAQSLHDPRVLDFTFFGDPSVEVTADVIVGVIRIQARIETEKLNVLESYLGATLASVCPTQVRVIDRTYQEIESYEYVNIDLLSLYFLLPSNRDSAECKNGLTNIASFQQLLAWRIASDRSNGPSWDVASWGMQFEPATVKRRQVLWPRRLPRPTLSTTPPGPLDPFAGQNFNWGGLTDGSGNGTGVDDPNCRYAKSACICATTTSCAWLPYQGSHRCIGLSGPPTDISCDDCALQGKCARNQAQACDLNREPCTCALSSNICRWDLSTMSCIPQNGVSTPCTVCSRQDHCDAPTVRSVAPAAGSRFGVGNFRDVRVTFDRTVSLQSVMEGVTIQCQGDLQPTPVTQNLLTVQGEVLRIEVAGIPVESEAGCDLALGEGVVRDGSGLNFKGTSASWYAFRLQDTIAPLLNEFTPRNGAEDVAPGTSATMVFNEPVRLRTPCEVSLFERSTLVTSFQLDSVDVALQEDRRTMTVDVGPFLEYSRTYSLRLPEGCASDTTGNLFQGLGEGVYMFHTQIESYNRPTEEDPLKIILGIAIGAAAGLVILVSCCVVWCRMRGEKKRFDQRLAETAKQPRRWSVSSLEGVWSELSQYRPRRFSMDGWAMQGMSKTVPPDEELASKSNTRKVHPDPTLVTAQAARSPTSRPGTGDSKSTRAPTVIESRPTTSGSMGPRASAAGDARPSTSGNGARTSAAVELRPSTSGSAPQRSTVRVSTSQGPRSSAVAEGNLGPRPPLARPPSLMWEAGQ